MLRSHGLDNGKNVQRRQMREPTRLQFKTHLTFPDRVICVRPRIRSVSLLLSLSYFMRASLFASFFFYFFFFLKCPVRNDWRTFPRISGEKHGKIRVYADGKTSGKNFSTLLKFSNVTS